MNKLRKGDEVVVIAGKNKGQRGRILRVLPEQQKALVENINMVKKAVRPNPSTNEEGGIKEQERPIAISNLMAYHSKAGKGMRVNFKMNSDGKKVRVFSDGTEV